jgi:tetratricopeptide (TPR) repeat protein
MKRMFGWFVALLIMDTKVALAGAFEIGDQTFSCLATMSCRPELQLATSKKNRSLSNQSKMSKTWDSNACDSGKSDLIDQASLSACQSVLNSGSGTSAQREEAYVRIGYSYQWQFERTFEHGRNGPRMAQHSFELALALNPNNLDALFAVAINGQHIGESVESSLAVFERIIAIAPLDWRGYFGRAELLGKTGDLAGALAASQKLLEVAPDNVVSDIIHAKNLAANHLFQEAAKHFERATKHYDFSNRMLPGVMQPQNPWFGWAEANRAMEQSGKAADIMRAYIDSKPSGYHSQNEYVTLAMYLTEAGRHREAAESYDRASRMRGLASPEDMRIERTLSLMRAGVKNIDLSELEHQLGKFTLRKNLKLQVFLRNRGFDSVEINGKFDLATKAALIECASKNKCFAVKGDKL